MIQRREPGSGRIEDMWVDRKKQPTKRHGRGKRWRARWVDLDGKERTQAFSLKEEAKVFLTAEIARVMRGEHLDKNRAKITINELYAEWEPTVLATNAPSTRYNRASWWRMHVQPEWGRRQVARIRKNEVTHWVSTMHSNGVGTALISQCVSLLRLILNYAQDSEIITTNPATNIKLPRQEKARRAYLNVPQVEAVAAIVERVAGRTLTTPTGEPVTDENGDEVIIGGETMGTLVRLLAYTGLRWGEATALTPSCIDTDKRRLDVHRAFSSVGGKIIEGTPKTHELRYVPYPAVLDKELVALMKGKTPQALLFTNTRGAPLANSNFRNRLWNPALEQLRTTQTSGNAEDSQQSAPGAPMLSIVGGSGQNKPDNGETDKDIDPLPGHVTIHDLRHTAASLAISAGANVKAVQAMLGHKSAVMTLDTYADLFDDDLDAVGVALGSLIEARRA